MRIPTDGGAAWFKATGRGPGHEGPLLEVFRELGVRRVVLPLAIDPERRWLLFDEAGPTLRRTRPDGHGDHDLAAWLRILPEYAELQRSVENEPAANAMLAAGTPDGRPGPLLDELARLLDDDLIWSRVSDEERAAADTARNGLRASGPRLAALIGELAATGIPASIQHDDLHGNNIVAGPDGDRFFDWGDGVIAHPFSTLTATFNSIAYHTGRTPDDPAFGRLLDAYLEAWTDLAPRADLVRAAALARGLGCVGRSLAWERALLDLEPDEMDGHGDAIAGWLMEFADRLERLPGLTR